MSDIYIPLVIPLSNTAANTVVNTSKFTYPTYISLIGILGTSDKVTIQIPTTNSPDINVPADWQNFYQNGSNVTITQTNHSVAVPGGLVLKINKPATSNVVGIRWP